MSNAANPLVPVDGTMTVTDGAALSWAMVYDEGDFKINGLSATFKDMQQFKSRGKVYAARDIEDTAIEVSFTCHAVMMIGDGTTATIGDIVLRKGPWAAYTSTLPAAAGDAKCVQIVWRGERSNYGASVDVTLTLKYLHLTAEFSEGVPGKFAVKGELVTYSTDFIAFATV